MLDLVQPDYKCFTLYLFLQKIKEYEEELFNIILNIVGLPLLNVGDFFSFRNRDHSKFKIIRVCKVESNQPQIIKTKQLVQYKYCYTNIYLNHISFAYYIYDYFFKNNLVYIIKPPLEP